MLRAFAPSDTHLTTIFFNHLLILLMMFECIFNLQVHGFLSSLFLKYSFCSMFEYVRNAIDLHVISIWFAKRGHYAIF